jgi:putative ABC transport system permease protein
VASPRWGGTRGVLVSAQVALSVLLLVGAGLLVKGFLRVAPTAPGFALERRVAVSVLLRDGGAYDDPSRQGRWTFARDVMRRMAALPGVRAVALTTTAPLTLATALRDVTPDAPNGSAPGPAVRSHQRSVSSNYFDLMGIPIVAGRGLLAGDDAGAEPVAVVNQTAAARWWPKENPVGRRFSFTAASSPRPLVVRVVGVARDARFNGADTRTRAEFFVPYAQSPLTTVTFIVHSSAPWRAIAPALQEQIWAVDPKLPIRDVSSLEDIAGASLRDEHFYLVMMSVFAAVAVCIAAAGMFGVLTQMVQRRQKDIGIRLALGAPRYRIGADVLRQGAVITGAGLAAGSVAAYALTRFLGSLLLEVSATDGEVFAAVMVVTSGIALLISMAPLRKALGVDPVESLRTE